MAMPRILQICHGQIIPEYISAYSLRCHNLLKNYENRLLVSAGGPVLVDKNMGNSRQYRSVLIMIMSYLKGNRSFEVFLSMGKYLRKKYVHDVIKEIKKSDIIIFEGPWQYQLFRPYIKDKFIIYDAHNYETGLRSGNPYENYVSKIEQELLKNAHMILSLSVNDIMEFKKIIDESKIFYIPLLTENKNIEWNGMETNNIVFIGSLYQANIDAVRHILEMSAKLPEFNFIIIGNVKNYKFKESQKNVKFLGVIDDAKKDMVLRSACMAVNPVMEGSGRNLKVLDYLSYGIPVVSTKIGLRSYDEYNTDNNIIIGDIQEFPEKIRYLCKNRELLRIQSFKSLEMYKKIIKSEGNINPAKIILNEYKKLNHDIN